MLCKIKQSDKNIIPYLWLNFSSEHQKVKLFPNLQIIIFEC